jgi:hypothetical protein
MRVIFFICYFFSLNVAAQSNLSNEWITGASGPCIKFDNGFITTSHSHYILSYFSSGNSNICDSNGNLILASDGCNVYDSLGNYIEEGDTLTPLNYYVQEFGWSSYSQSSIFLPMDSDKYYFINTTFSDSRLADCIANNNCFFDLLLYNVIDMKANGGAGKVIQRMIPLMQNAQLRKTQMMACRHANGKDWWLLKQEGENADVHTFLFTQDSVYDKGVKVFSSTVWGKWDIRGQSVFSVDGSYYASTSHGGSTGKIFMANFDRCYGKLSNPSEIIMPIGSENNPNNPTATEHLSVGLAYSPNGQFLYVISMRNIYQYDLQDQTWFHVAGLDTTHLQFQDYDPAYLGPDEKIYIGNFAGQSKQMSRIDNPDVKGAGCNFCPRCLRLDSLVVPQGNYSAGTPPCMPNYSLGAKVCDPEGVEDVEKEDMELLVYPNPSTSKLHISTKSKANRLLYNSVGELIISTRKNEIDISHLPRGVYFLKVGNMVRKVIVE